MLRRPRHPYSLLTLCAAIAILVLGVAFKPEKKAARALSESDLSRMQPAPGIRLNDVSRELAESSGNAAPRLVYLQSTPHTAVLWDNTRAITGLNAIGETPEWKAVPTPSGVPFAIWSLPAKADVALGEPAATVTIANGDWVLAVARASADRTVFAEGIYQGIGDGRCGGFDFQEVNSSAKISPSLLGGGLFGADGTLLGVIATCNGEPVVVSAASVAAVLRLPVFVTDRLEKDFGLRVSGSAGALRATIVWSGSAADAAGVKAGDVISQADGHAVAQWSDLEPLEDGDAHSLSVRRGQRMVRISLVRSSADIKVDGLTLLSRASNVMVSEVARDSAGARANLQPGDVLIRVGGVAVGTPEAAARALASHAKGTVPLTIQRGSARAEVMLVP